MKNIKTDFGAIGDGANDDSQAFINFNTWATSQSAMVDLIIPPGQYITNNAISPIGLRWMQGIKRLMVTAYGAQFTAPQAIIGSQVIWPQVAASFCLISDAHAGDMKATLKNVSDAAKFTVGNWIAVTAYDMQGGSSYPPSAYLFEYRKVKAIDTAGGVITFESELRNNYLSTYPVGSAVSGGPASLVMLADYWDSELIIKGIEFAQNSVNDVFGSARRVVLEDCKFTHHGWAATSCQYIRMVNCDLGPFIELDKEIEQIELDGCYMNDNASGSQTLLVQSSNVVSMHMNNCQLRNLTGTPTHFVARNSTFKAVQLGTIAYGCTKSALFENCYVGAFNPVQNGSIAVAPASIVNGVITLPLTKVPPQGLYPGSVMFATDAVSGGNIFPLSFSVLNVRSDGISLFADTTLPSSFSAPLVAGNYRFQRHPCPNLTVLNCYGCDDIVNASHAPSGKPCCVYVRKLLTGYIGSNSATTAHSSMRIWGIIVSVTVNVLRAYSGVLGTLSLKLGAAGPRVTVDGVTAFNWDASINLKVPGKRVFTAAGSTGLQTGDVDPKSGAIWFLNTVTPFLSGDTSSDPLENQAVVDLEIITDQGLPGIENFQFGGIKYPGL